MVVPTVDTVASPIGTIDVNASVLLARGQLFTEPGRMIVDMANRAEIAFTGGVRFDRDVPVSLAGTYTGSGPVRTLRQSCPGNGETRVFVSAAGDALTLGFDPVNFGGINISIGGVSAPGGLIGTQGGLLSPESGINR